MIGKYIGSGLCSIGIRKELGIGSGILLGSFIFSISKNMYYKDELFSLTIICFALIESLALFSLILSFIILFG